MSNMWLNSGFNKGITRLNPTQYAEQVVRIMSNKHGNDVIARMRDFLGARADRMGPVDLSRNVLLSWLGRVCRAYFPPPLVSDLPEGLARALGDMSASTTVERYAEAGGRPMPTTAAQASHEAYRYEQAAGFSGVLIGWSERTGRMSLQVISPDDLDPEYDSDDPTEPTIIRHRGRHYIGSQWESTVGVYDLTDIKNPSYRLLKDGDESRDVTELVHGQTYSGPGYVWRYADGRPFHRIVLRGHPDRLYQRLQQVEASLIVPMRWTAWGSGVDFASHPGRNVRGLKLAGLESGPKGSGFADGPEIIKRWIDVDEQRPGDHWQDAPAYNPLDSAQAIAFYENLTLTAVDLPVDIHSTGGEPTAREAEALEETIAQTLPECRRFDGELLRRCAALANRLPNVEGEGFPEEHYGALYRAEVAEALKRAAELKAFHAGESTLVPKDPLKDPPKSSEDDKDDNTEE